MMSVFTLVSAFVGGMNVAMDSIAGERERRSLLVSNTRIESAGRLLTFSGSWVRLTREIHVQPTKRESPDGVVNVGQRRVHGNDHEPDVPADDQG